MNDAMISLLADVMITTDNSETSSVYIVSGVWGGFVVGAIANPLVGLFLFSGVAIPSLIEAWYMGNKRYKVLTGKISPISIMNPSQIIRYKQIVGEEKFREELSVTKLVNPESKVIFENY